MELNFFSYSLITYLCFLALVGPLETNILLVQKYFSEVQQYQFHSAFFLLNSSKIKYITSINNNLNVMISFLWKPACLFIYMLFT